MITFHLLALLCGARSGCRRVAAGVQEIEFTVKGGGSRAAIVVNENGANDSRCYRDGFLR